MLHQIQQAIQPSICLREVIENWSEISMALREPARRRSGQNERYFLS